MLTSAKTVPVATGAAKNLCHQHHRVAAFGQKVTVAPVSAENLISGIQY